MFLSALPVLVPQLVQAQQTGKTSDVVLGWNDTALAAIQTLELRPPIATYCLAMALAAIFDNKRLIAASLQLFTTFCLRNLS
jgi:hypothetical protein